MKRFRSQLEVPVGPGYYWMPACLDALSLVINVGIEYGSFKTLGFKKIEKPRVVRIYQFPDRRVFVSAADFPEKIQSRLDKHLDFRRSELMNLPPFIMFNALDKGGPRNHEYRGHLSTTSFVLQDSGGFQLISGAKDFVDPKYVGRVHSAYADCGVTLDLPTYGVYDERLVVKCAKLQAENSRTLISEMKGIPLMDVVHGTSVPQRKKYLDIVLEEPHQGLCIASLKSSFTENGRSEVSPEIFMSHMLYILERTRKHYSYYHLLGTSTRWQMVLLALLAQRYQVTITSDSSTYLQYAQAGQDYDFLDTSVFVGNSGFNQARMTCVCKLCRTLQYRHIYQTSPHTFSLHLIQRIRNTADNFRLRAAAEKATDWIWEEAPSISRLKKEMQLALELFNSPYSEKKLNPKNFAAAPALFGHATDRHRQSILSKYEDYYGKKF